jgi:hypothetical protein
MKSNWSLEVGGRQQVQDYLQGGIRHFHTKNPIYPQVPQIRCRNFWQNLYRFRRP